MTLHTSKLAKIFVGCLNSSPNCGFVRTEVSDVFVFPFNIETNAPQIPSLVKGYAFMPTGIVSAFWSILQLLRTSRFAQIFISIIERVVVYMVAFKWVSFFKPQRKSMCIDRVISSVLPNLGNGIVARTVRSLQYVPIVFHKLSIAMCANLHRLVLSQGNKFDRLIERLGNSVSLHVAFHRNPHSCATIRRFFILALLLIAPSAIYAQNSALNGFCEVGGIKATTSGSASSNTFQASYPRCLVSVFLTGTTTKATLFTDNGITPLANPFTANLNGSWLFYAANGTGLDIVMSGGTPIPFPTPFTLVDLIPGGNSGGGSGGTVTNFGSGNLAPLFTTSVANPTTVPALTFTLTPTANTTFLGNISGSSAIPAYVTLAAGANITFTPSGNTLTIAATGGGGSCSGTSPQIAFLGLTGNSCQGDSLFLDHGAALGTPGLEYNGNGAQFAAANAGSYSFITSTPSGGLGTGASSFTSALSDANSNDSSANFSFSTNSTGGASGNYTIALTSDAGANSGNLTIGSNGTGANSNNLTLTTSNTVGGSTSGNIELTTAGAGHIFLTTGATGILGLFGGVHLNVESDDIVDPGSATIPICIDVDGNLTTTCPAGGGAVSSVANSDGTLTISPTTGSVIASLALGHNNTWSGTQTFNNLTVTGTCTGCTGGTTAFGSLSSGTNTTAAMLVGTAASLGVTGSGTIAATSAPASGLTGSTLASGVTASSLTSLGTITTGVWSGTLIAANKGGTGVANTATLTLGSSNQNWATLGTGIVKNTTTTGALTIAAAGTDYVAPGGAGSISGLTTGFLPKAASATTLNNSHIDDGITTASTITMTENLVVNTGGPINSAQLGTNIFSALPTCAGGTEGTWAPVPDSTTATWGATVTGGSTNHILAYCDGTNWTVAAK